MTEQDYINVRQLSQIACAKDCLRGIIPESSIVIPENEFRDIMMKLAKWEAKLWNQIMIKND